MRGQLWYTGEAPGFTAALFETHFDISGVQTLQDAGHHNIREIWGKWPQLERFIWGWKKTTSVMKQSQ